MQTSWHSEQEDHCATNSLTWRRIVVIRRANLKSTCKWARYVALVALLLMTMGRVLYENQLAQSAGIHLRHELPHLIVDLANHSYSKRQQEGYLHMSSLSCFGGLAVDGRGAVLYKSVGKVSERTSASRALSPGCVVC